MLLRVNHVIDKDCFELFAFIFHFIIFDYMVFGALAKNGSFGFAKGRLVCSFLCRFIVFVSSISMIGNSHSFAPLFALFFLHSPNTLCIH
jgi:hypothetical protein